MSSEQLESLDTYLEQKIKIYGYDHTLTLIKVWLDENIAKSKKSKVIMAIQNQGCFCDCVVLMSVIY
ncbi:DUF2695 domain-containing protein [Thermaerobacillus caldiproteolyticus]|uniref:DUF2695 domain-containing protein n=1 Tax=Thermaerobacillus caldiproteolyticus TaxID=247480 RepID=UPI001E422BDF|nr:DUF2695 domain-containing protein [Anoxybacillus caldiproteolyticus]